MVVILFEYFRMSRFTTDTVDAVMSDAYSDETKRMDCNNWKLLQNYLYSTGQQLDPTNIPQLDNTLAAFFASVKQKDGSNFASTSFNSLKYSIARLIQKHHSLSIIKDHRFTRLNATCRGVMKRIKNDGKGMVSHHPRITDADLEKVFNMEISNPRRLQLAVWFTIQLNFLKRGRENVDTMKKSYLIFRVEDGKQFMTLRDTLSKNHRETDLTVSTAGRLYATGDDNCPINLVKNYLEMLSPINEYLWQRPKESFNGNRPYFCNMKVGKNTVATYMKQISTLASLSRTYTNHSVRTTGINVLSQSFQDTEIQMVSGHKSLTALAMYKNPQPSTLQAMSNYLMGTSRLNNPRTNAIHTHPVEDNSETSVLLPNSAFIDSNSAPNTMQTCAVHDNNQPPLLLPNTFFIDANPNLITIQMCGVHDNIEPPLLLPNSPVMDTSSSSNLNYN